jgi:hypothetical protein
MKITKLKIRFAGETRFGVPTRQIFRTWKQLLSGTRLSFHSAAMAKRSEPAGRGTE